MARRALTLLDELFLTAAGTLAELVVGQSDLDQGSLYSPLKNIRQISLEIGISLATPAYGMKLARARRRPNVWRSVARLHEP